MPKATAKPKWAFTEKEYRALVWRLDLLVQQSAYIQRKEEQEMANLDDLKASVANLREKVTKIETAGGSAVVLMQTLSQQLRDLIAAGGDPTEIIANVDAYAAELDAKATEIGDAVVANTV